MERDDETIEFFEQPILNSPYEEPTRHWTLDENGQPTGEIAQGRRKTDFKTPVPKPKKAKGGQAVIAVDEGEGLTTEEQSYHADLINRVRDQVDAWRRYSGERGGGVTPYTAKLLEHWRSDAFRSSGYRPFFCQVEAVETAVWLTEVAPNDRNAKRFLEPLDAKTQDPKGLLSRLALKMATGAGKTAVMAMLIAWQTVNAVRMPNSRRFTKAFLIVTPGITIKDRLRVLNPEHPENYYQRFQLIPESMRGDIQKAKIVITNYHAFKRRDRFNASNNTRGFLYAGRQVNTLETDGMMLQRVMPELMSSKNVFIINDEAHHCYREKTEEEADAQEKALKGEEKDESKKNREAARLWISGIEAVARELGPKPARVIDLSATPYFLRGSGYAEGTLFPWTMSDFSLMDAIECGIVKLPRVPVADNVPQDEMPKYRNLWEHIGKEMPKKGRRKSAVLDPQNLPTELQTALDAVYGHYERTFELREEARQRTLAADGGGEKSGGIDPCFIVVCNNTASSKLIYDYIAGYRLSNEEGAGEFRPGKFELFKNYDDEGKPLPKPRTLLIDSLQLESDDKLTNEFKNAAAEEIDRFRREYKRHSQKEADDKQILREVMNTVGKPNQLGSSIRCVVSVSMLTEGWDANNVTHILGVRAFGTQLLCEQVVGRALRRQSYQLNDRGLFDVEYADILGVPFDFTAKPVYAQPSPPPSLVVVRAESPERDRREIEFPQVRGYHIEKPRDEIRHAFTEESKYKLSPQEIGPTRVQVAGIIGEPADYNIEHLKQKRRQEIEYKLTYRLLTRHWGEGDPPIHLFGQAKRVVRQWIDECLTCAGGTEPAQLLYGEIADTVCERIRRAIDRADPGEGRIQAVLDAYNRFGSTKHVHYFTAKQDLYRTDPRKCHVNYAVLDSDWEAEFCRAAEGNPQVLAYVKNDGLGFEIPYRHGGRNRAYRPDFLLKIDDGRGEEDPLHLVAEVKGMVRESDSAKIDAAQTYWVPGVNNRGGCGRWAFAPFYDVDTIENQLRRFIRERWQANGKTPPGEMPVDNRAQ